MFKQKIFVLLLLIGFSYQEDDECFAPFCSCVRPFVQNLVCRNFNSFKQLGFDTIESSKVWKSLTLIPNEPIQLNDELDISKLKFFENSTIRFYYIESIYTQSKIFKNLDIRLLDNRTEKSSGSIKLFFTKSTILFLPFQEFNTTKIQFYTNCKYDEIENEKYLFSNTMIDYVEFFDSSFPNTMLICPLVFYNSNIDEIEFAAVKGKIRFRNVTFSNDIDRKTIKSKIRRVNLYENDDDFVDDLNKFSLLNEYIFEKVQEIWVIGTYLQYIDDQTLQNLKYLRKLHLERVTNPIPSSKTIIMDLNWLINLNKRISSFNFDNFNTEYFLNNYLELVIEDFPDLINEENLCLIAKFPINNLVIPKLQLNDRCTCPVYWLYRQYTKNFIYASLLPDDAISCFNGLTNQIINSTLESCNPNKKCNAESTSLIPTTISTTTMTTKTITTTKNVPVTTSTFRTTKIIFNNSSFISYKPIIIIKLLFLIIFIF